MENWVLDVVFGVVGLFLTSAAVHAYVTYGLPVVAGERATGRVVAIETKAAVESDLYAPVIEFTTGPGEAITIRGPASSGKEYDIGQSVSVAYRREDPRAGRVIDAMAALAGPTVELLTGLGFIALVIARMASGRQRGREHEVVPHEVEEIERASGGASQIDDDGTRPRSTALEAIVGHYPLPAPGAAGQAGSLILTTALTWIFVFFGMGLLTSFVVDIPKGQFHPLTFIVALPLGWAAYRWKSKRRVCSIEIQREAITLHRHASASTTFRVEEIERLVRSHEPLIVAFLLELKGRRARVGIPAELPCHEALESILVATGVVRDSSGDDHPAWAPSTARPALTPSERARALRALFLRTRLAQWGVGSSLLMLLLAPVGKSFMPAAVTRAMIALSLPLLGVSIAFSLLLRPKCPQCRTYIGGEALLTPLRTRCPRCGLSMAPDD